MKVTIIYPVEPSYIFGLIDGLSKKDISIDLIGSDRMKQLENKYKNVNVINLRGSQDTNVRFLYKFTRIMKFYVSLMKYITKTDSDLIHIHWPNRFFFFDSTILLLFYKMVGKKIVYTAHNIDQGMRDKDAGDRRKVYKFLYNIVDHIIVHNNFSLRILKERFNVPDLKISVEKMGIIKAPSTNLSSAEAKNFFSFPINKKVMLFFGGINEYKGLDLLLKAFIELTKENEEYFLLIAGQPRDKTYFNSIQNLIGQLEPTKNCLTNFDFIPYEDVEKYFMAADCIVLPYKYIFQSAVYALSFSFGLPVVATDVGSFKEEDIIEGKNGYVCKPNDVADLKNTIVKYFNSELYDNLSIYRNLIKQWAEETYSWDAIGEDTYRVYTSVLKQNTVKTRKL